nr:MAG: hypothetical protein DIU80_07135 [Chloroflexota bacterium]
MHSLDLVELAIIERYLRLLTAGSAST